MLSHIPGFVSDISLAIPMFRGAASKKLTMMSFSWKSVYCPGHIPNFWLHSHSCLVHIYDSIMYLGYLIYIMNHDLFIVFLTLSWWIHECISDIPHVDSSWISDLPHWGQFPKMYDSQVTVASWDRRQLHDLDDSHWGYPNDFGTIHIRISSPLTVVGIWYRYYIYIYI